MSAVLQDPSTSAPSPLRASSQLLGETLSWGPGARGAWQHPEEQHQPLEQVRMVLGRVLEMCAAEPRERERLLLQPGLVCALQTRRLQLEE